MQLTKKTSPLKRSLLSPFALAAALTVCAPMAALAMPAAPQPVSAVSSATTPADYLYQGHHYHYHYNGHYYNHRTRKGSNWSYN